MTTVILDEALKAKLNGMEQPLELRDEKGHLIGHFLPPAAYRKLLYAAVEAACPFSAEELERRRQETGGRPLAEIWQSLGQP
ncbi:MAG: hypothetical protein L0Z62_30865 [Gemmataceae bacterium]|nr:hypothetical protein [Gemmataceae bacterium]